MPNHDASMTCPIDGTTLVMSERSGIEIDYCPSCRGVWLDRGELDKIIERNAQAAPEPARPEPASQRYREDRGYREGRGNLEDQDRREVRGHRSDQGYAQQGYPKHKRKKSFLEELFD